MTPDRPTLARLREQAGQARQAGHYPRAAHLERQAVELAETLGLAGERARALLWQGYSLRQAGEDDLALAALLQAINEPAPTADPADRFGALIAILHISLERKPVHFCRALLEQGRRELAESRQPWLAPLDFLEGELAYRRGDFAAAWNWHERAWAGRRETHPRLTPATHLWARCHTAFRRHEPADVERLAQQLRELRPNSALERPLVLRAQWLAWRARRAATADAADPAPVEQARVFLTKAAAEREPRDFGARIEALRVLALAGDWDPITADLRQKPLHPDAFETAIGLGDLALGRVRAALGLPAVDDDYGAAAVYTPHPNPPPQGGREPCETIGCLAPPPLRGRGLGGGGEQSQGAMTVDVVAPSAVAPDSDRVAAAFGEAEQGYREAGRFAGELDQRLQTRWYGDTVQERQARLNQLRSLCRVDERSEIHHQRVVTEGGLRSADPPYPIQVEGCIGDHAR